MRLKFSRPTNPTQDLSRQVIVVRAGLLVMAACAGLLLAFVLTGQGEAEVVPEPVSTPAEETSEPEAGETEINEEEFSRQELETMFAGPAEIRDEAEALVADMDPAITDMDKLLTEAEAVGETCELEQIYQEIDSLALSHKRGELGQRTNAFLAAVQQGVLPNEFSLAIDEGILSPDFDFKALDESILPEGFEENASETGQDLKPEIIKMRQRVKKIASLTHRLEALDEKRKTLEPQCNVVH